MIITVHSVLENGKNTDYGLNDEGYERAMDYMNSIRNESEYFATDEEIDFQWDMTDEGFHRLMRPGNDDADDVSDYLGAVFFGNYKLEFIWNDIAGAYNNMFWYGKEEIPGNAYAYLDNGTPYEEIDPAFVIPMRRTFESFAKNIEAQIIKWLNDNPEYIEDALVKTDPDKWYTNGYYNSYTPNITRRA